MIEYMKTYLNWSIHKIMSNFDIAENIISKDFITQITSQQFQYKIIKGKQVFVINL